MCYVIGGIPHHPIYPTSNHDRYIPRQQLSFGWKNANGCAILEDIPEGKEGETNEEAERATLILNINSSIKSSLSGVPHGHITFSLIIDLTNYFHPHQHEDKAHQSLRQGREVDRCNTPSSPSMFKSTLAGSIKSIIFIRPRYSNLDVILLLHLKFLNQHWQRPVNPGIQL